MEYYSLFAEYLNIFSILFDGIKTALLSFIAALIILIILKKYVLIKRCNDVLKYLSWSYYFFIPVICLFFGLAYGVLTSARDQIMEKLPMYQASIQTFINQNVNVEIEFHTFTDKSLDKTIDEAVVDVQRILLAELHLKNENQNSVQQFTLTVLDSPIGTRFLKLQLKEKIASISGLNKNMVDEVFEIKLSDILTGDVIIKIVGFYIGKAFSGLVIPVVIIWIVLLLLPLIEVVFANRYNRKYPMIYDEQSK